MRDTITNYSINLFLYSGQGLAFISYPDALSTLPVPQLFTVMFFFMLFLLGIDSEFALLETVLTCIYDGVSEEKMSLQFPAAFIPPTLTVNCVLIQS